MAQVDIVMPLYNKAETVGRAIESIQGQSFTHWRLIVIDDGSANHTPDNVEKWMKEHQLRFPVRLIRQSNQGLAAARNRAASEAGECDVFAFLDDDDLWPKDYIKRVRSVMSDQPDLAAASADRFDINMRKGTRKLRTLDKINENTTELLFVEGLPGNPNTVFRAGPYRDSGGYDEFEHRCAEDVLFMLKLSLSNKWGHIPGDPVIIRRETQDTKFAAQLHKGIPDSRLRLAQMMEQFALHEGGREVMRGSLWKKRLGRMWYSAGRQLRGLGRNSKATECFERALALLPWHFRARLRVLASRCRLGKSMPGVGLL